jgi:hypothetical protein
VRAELSECGLGLEVRAAASNTGFEQEDHHAGENADVSVGEGIGRVRGVLGECFGHAQSEALWVGVEDRRAPFEKTVPELGVVGETPGVTAVVEQDQQDLE